MNCDDLEFLNRPTCCCCDEPAAFRCHRCGEFYCRHCLGPGQAEAGGPCRDCSVKPAPRDLESASPNVIVYGEDGAIPGVVEKPEEPEV
jgi:hypothetical protein